MFFLPGLGGRHPRLPHLGYVCNGEGGYYLIRYVEWPDIGAYMFAVVRVVIIVFTGFIIVFRVNWRVWAALTMS